jgi:intracellular sulfur oxidation DsrE/DsrF family protein
MEKLKVIIHVNEMDRWSVALGNVVNLFAAVGEDNADVIVLSNGNSVGIYEDRLKVEDLRTVAKKGARFHVCRNSLNKLKAAGTISFTEEGLPDFTTVVPAGIAEVINRQHGGYAYVKP